MNKSKSGLLMAMLLFGSIGLFVRQIELASSQIALARGVIGSLVLILASFLLKEPFCWGSIKANLKLLILSGVAIGLNWVFLFEAYKYTSIAIATICYYLAPIFVMILAPILLKERLKAVQVISIIAAMIGMICITGTGSLGGNSNHILGIIYGIAAAILYASVMLMNKKLKELSSFESTVPQLLIAAIAVLPYVLVTEGINYSVIGIRSIILLLVVGVIHTGLSYLLYFASFKKLSAHTIATFSYIDPISAILMSVILLREPMSILEVIGGILIIGGIYIDHVYESRQNKASMEGVIK